MDGTEYLWQGDENYWSDRALNLFPDVARLWEGNTAWTESRMEEMDVYGWVQDMLEQWR